jgi:protein subunit release factor A
MFEVLGITCLFGYGLYDLNKVDKNITKREEIKNKITDYRTDIKDLQDKQKLLTRDCKLYHYYQQDINDNLVQIAFLEGRLKGIA